MQCSLGPHVPTVTTSQLMLGTAQDVTKLFVATASLLTAQKSVGTVKLHSTVLKNCTLCSKKCSIAPHSSVFTSALRITSLFLSTRLTSQISAISVSWPVLINVLARPFVPVSYQNIWVSAQWNLSVVTLANLLKYPARTSRVTSKASVLRASKSVKSAMGYTRLRRTRHTAAQVTFTNSFKKSRESRLMIDSRSTRDSSS